MYDKPVGARDRTKARGFLSTFGIKVKYSKSTNWADGGSSIVSIATDGDRAEFWSAVFHELVHVLCYRDGKYKLYHRKKPKGMGSKEYDAKVRMTALKAELYVDRRAERLMKEFFPKMPYVRAYRSKEDVAWYKKEYLGKHYPKKR